MFGIHSESHQSVTYGHIFMTLILSTLLNALIGGFRASQSVFKSVQWFTKPFGGVSNPGATSVVDVLVALSTSAAGFGLGWLTGHIADGMGMSRIIVVPAIPPKD